MTIEISTREFGIIEVEEDAVYEFPEGIYGFESDKRFAVFSRQIEDFSFLYLQSMDHLVPCFMVFEPWDMHPDYQPALSREDLDDCQVDHIDDLIFLVIATVPSKMEDLSINIKSPVVLNPKTRKAKQVILQNPDYSVRYYPFRQNGKGGSSC
jgi:flagellar assembly factor FliW